MMGSLRDLNVRRLGPLGLALLSLGLGACGESGVISAAGDVLWETQAPDTQAPDLVVDDVGSADMGLNSDSAGSACEPGTGCFAESCTDADDCQSSICTPHQGDNVCSKTCDATCPQGWSCTLVGSAGGDGQYVCLSNFSHLCLPCDDSADCSTDVPNACVAYPDGLSFCGGACGLETPCPEGYACQEVETSAGAKSYQCLAKSGMCLCSNLAIASNLATPCALENEHGMCEGVRTCAADGLMPCSAAEPALEVCNAVDDDCNGLTDEATCDDGNPCTDDACLGAEGCAHTALDAGECLDGSACTQADHCEAGVCVGEVLQCDDGNGCTDESCDASLGCVYSANFESCDDGEPCTLGDACKSGACAAGAALLCDDGNACTDDLCGKVGCVFESNTLPCDDGNACTAASACQAGGCTGSLATECGDGNGCTDDGCDPATGCLATANVASCDDGDTCTVGDVCAMGACLAGGPLTCVDGNPCTDDGCDTTLGCVFPANTAPCDDQNNCTTADVCTVGACVGAGSLACDDGNPCTVDSCLPQGGCSHDVGDGVCSDGDPCTVDDTCSAGACVGGSGMICDDGNGCTTDSCDGGECTFLPQSGACDDGNACTDEAACTGGACVGTLGKDCSDGNGCTDDGCDPVNGCLAVNNVASCGDGDPCTVGDVCGAGACQAGELLLACDDGNSCTDDACEVGTGCVFSHHQAACDDENACTSASFCSAGLCVATEVAVCDDANACTNDGCDPGSGCVFDNNTSACEDGDACTLGDSCSGGLCASGADSLVCDDGFYCNGAEQCSPAQGCVAGTPPATSDDIACTLDSCDEAQDVIAHLAVAEQCPEAGLCEQAVCDLDLGCQVEVQGGCCGNGVTEVGEDCDDGNSVDDDACPNDCDISLGFEHSDGFNTFYNQHPVDVHSEARAIDACNHYWQSQGVNSGCAKQGCGGATYVIGNHDVNCNNSATQRIWYFGIEGNGYVGGVDDWAGVTVKPPPDLNNQSAWY